MHINIEIQSSYVLQTNIFPRDLWLISYVSCFHLVCISVSKTSDVVQITEVENQLVKLFKVYILKLRSRTHSYNFWWALVITVLTSGAELCWNWKWSRELDLPMNNKVHKLTDWISRSDLLNNPRLLREMFLWIHRRDQLADRSGWQELFFSRFSLKQKNRLNILNTLRQICLLYKYLYWWKTTSELLIRAFYDPSDGLQYLSTSSIKPKMWKLYTNDLDKAPGLN